MNLLPIIQHEYFEIKIKAGTATSRIYFPDIHKLRFANLRGLEIYTEYEFGIAINNFPVLPQSNTVDSFVTLKNLSGKAFVDKRYTSLFYPDNKSNPFAPFYPKDFVGQVVNWPNSYIDFVRPLVSGIDQTLCFSVYYSNDEEIVDKGVMEEYVKDVHNTRAMPLIKSQYTELVVPVGKTQKIYFPVIENLRDVHYRGIEVISFLNANYGFSGLPILDVNYILKSWTNLQLYTGEDSIQRINTGRFFTDNFGANPYTKIQPRGFTKQKINLPKSYIEFDPSIDVVEEFCIPINIYYEDDEVVELKDELYEFSNKL